MSRCEVGPDSLCRHTGRHWPMGAISTALPVRSIQGHPGACFLFRKIINDHEEKKWFNCENLLRTSCCLEMDSTKKSNTNGTMNLPHLIQCVSQDAVLLLFVLFWTVNLHPSADNVLLLKRTIVFSWTTKQSRKWGWNHRATAHMISEVELI